MKGFPLRPARAVLFQAELRHVTVVVERFGDGTTVVLAGEIETSDEAELESMAAVLRSAALLVGRSGPEALRNAATLLESAAAELRVRAGVR